MKKDYKEENSLKVIYLHTVRLNTVSDSGLCS